MSTEYEKIDEMTSVGSKELTNEVDSLKNIDKDITKIEDKCSEFIGMSDNSLKSVSVRVGFRQSINTDSCDKGCFFKYKTMVYL